MVIRVLDGPHHRDVKGTEKLGLLSGECVLVQGEERKIICAFIDNLDSWGGADKR